MMNQNEGPGVLERLRSLIQDLGYRAQVEGEIIITSMAGTKASLRYYESGSIQLATGISDPPAHYDDEKINAYNARYRFGTLYRSEGNLFLQSNFLLLDPDAEHLREELEMIMGLYEGLVTALRVELSASELHQAE